MGKSSGHAMPGGMKQFRNREELDRKIGVVNGKRIHFQFAN